MRWRDTLIPTLREIPKDVEATSHQLMLRAGYIRKLSAGVYSYLPLGLRVLHKVSQIIREEMVRIGSEEVLLPALHPAELWRKSGRFETLGEDKISFTNRSGQEFVLGPTHEEVITELVGASIQSYQDLPLSLFQIQTKFRDELRPRFGIVRTKEFLMKDAYSFHRDESDLQATYQKYYVAYQNIMRRCGLEVKVVSADPGIMGGKVSDEFMVISPYGEDHIAISKEKNICVSCDLAFRSFSKEIKRDLSKDKKLQAFDTPNLKTIAELSEKFKIKPKKMVKTILYRSNQKMVAACVNGEAEINESKLRGVLGTTDLVLASPEEIQDVTGAPLGFSGPVGLKKVTIVVDADLMQMQNFVTGANQADKHYWNVNIGRDFKADLVADIRYVKEGDCPPDSRKPYELQTAMEVGHIFQLGTRYSKVLGANFRDEKGESHPIVMGCYGIGVNRLLAACIDQNHDKKGIVWPVSIAPFQVEILTVNHQDEKSRKVADSLYQSMKEKSFDVIYDDRNVRAGVKFNDADLIGIPVQIVMGERNLEKKQIEIKTRHNQQARLVSQDKVLESVKEVLQSIAKH